MSIPRSIQVLALVLTFSIWADKVHSSEIRVAVASNFNEAMKVLSARFEQQTGHHLVLIFGSTGKHYAQIKHGAPYDIFFAADTARPKLLEDQEVSIPDSRFTYAVGQLVLWSPKLGMVTGDLSTLRQGSFDHLAIANPKLAPYGRAAQQVLNANNLWAATQNKLVRGENIAQAFQFVKSGNAELGFVAYSQVKRNIANKHGSAWIVPESFYSPIEQQVVLLKDIVAAREFLSFVKTPASKKLIQSYGYGVDGAK